MSSKFSTHPKLKIDAKITVGTGDALTSIRNATYKWTVSGSGTGEYYLDLAAGGDPGLTEPAGVYENGSLLTAGTVGSLSASEWDWGDNDTLGFNTIYVRLADDADPDSKAADYVQYSNTDTINVAVQLVDRENGNELGERIGLMCYLADDANGDTPAATAPDTVAIGTDGALIEWVSNLSGLLITESDGDADINITENGADTWYLILVMPDGKLVASDAITFV